MFNVHVSFFLGLGWIPLAVILVLSVISAGGGVVRPWKILSTELGYCTQWTVRISVRSVLLCIKI